MICHVQKGKYGASLAFVRGCNLVIRAFFLTLSNIEEAKPQRTVILYFCVTMEQLRMGSRGRLKASSINPVVACPVSWVARPLAP